MTLSDRIEQKVARVAVVGQGYVGLPLAVELARAGFHVTGLETDPERVAALTRGDSYIPDVPSEALQDVLQAGRFSATTDRGVLASQDAIIICVPTPLRKSKDPDISHVVSAAEAVAAHLQRGQLVILESTTYPGTTDEVLLPTFQRGGLRGRSRFPPRLLSRADRSGQRPVHRQGDPQAGRRRHARVHPAGGAPVSPDRERRPRAVQPDERPSWPSSTRTRSAA